MEVSADVVQEFVQECTEVLQRVSQNLESIERGKSDSDVLNAVYRDVHTLKGSAQLLGYREIGAIAHALESSLDPIRKLGVLPSRPLMDTIFDCLNLFEAMIGEIREKGKYDSREEKITPLIGALIDRTSRLFHGDFQMLKELSVSYEEKRPQLQETTPTLPSPPPAAENIRQKMELTPSAPLELKLAESPVTPEPDSNPADNNKSNPAEGTESSIRVNVALLDRLMNLMGEMVLVRNQVIQHANKNEDLSFLALSQRLDVVTNELQDQVMRTRMQPIGNVIGNFQRLVRELAKDLGKRVDLTVHGKDTELDKTLLEAIKDPLSHIVRNSCDHGIESPQERLKAGKPETGHILISAFHEGGQVSVEISDDGRGLNREKILKKALEKGLITQDRLASITDREIIQLVFLPGFSTADQVSAVSGRGVGMDVVKTNIEKIGGTVELKSQPGRGSSIRLKVPLTLAVVPIMLVKSNGESFGIPQVNLVELVRAGKANVNAQLEFLQSQPVLRLRGNILPLVELSHFLGGPSVRDSLASQEFVNVVVLRGEGEPFGLIVDEVSDTADIVVKPLSKFLKALDVYSGATILGNGDVALILDIVGMAKRCKIASEKREEMDFRVTASQSVNTDTMEYLVFKLKAEGNYCVPLCLVHRLEEFARTKIELTGQQRVVQYRETILPLLDLNVALGNTAKANENTDTISVIVMKKAGRLYGIEVEAILDVVSSESMIDDPTADAEGIMGNLLLDKKLYIIVDALAIIDREFLGATTATKESSRDQVRLQNKAGKGPSILYVEDVAFFRKQVGNLLEKSGYTVITAGDGMAALEILKDKHDFELILSDIEMPRMNGYEFARSVRAKHEYSKTPLLALTTRFHKKDVEEGMRNGFDGYLEKLNPETLLREITRLLNPQEKELKNGTQ